MTNLPLTIRQAKRDDRDAVAALVYALLVELAPHYEGTDKRDAVGAATDALLTDGTGVWAFLAETAADDVVGVLTLNECAAIYAGGRFGEISELYVKPAFRSARAGALLIDAAADFGRARGWPMIEVGAPDLPKWQRTADFYRRYGFTEIGPRLELNL